MTEKKIYVLDTNVLLHDPTAIFNFKEATVGIPALVLEELDQFKGEGSGRGRSTREVIRLLDGLRSRGSLGEGVKLENGSVVKVLFLKEPLPQTPFKIDIKDNEILLTSLSAQQEGYSVTFISKDLNARVKADALGLHTEDYYREHVSEDTFYKGWVRIQVPAVQLKREFPEELSELAKEGLNINQFILVESQHNPHQYQVFRYLGSGRFRPVNEPQFQWPLKARNPQQLMALDLLFDNSVQMVTLFGPAGTGKTFLALLAGLHKVLVEDEYEKLLISRPVVPLGRDIGYLPGTIEEKLHSWMLPIYDNMEFIMHSSQMRQQLGLVDHEHMERARGKKRFKEKKEPRGLLPMEDLIKHNKLSLEAITYMRGRSIPYQWIFIDEVQNLSPHEVKTLVSRVGEGSKIVLSGDPYQIDSPYLDFSSNGLIVTGEKFKNQRIAGAVYLETSERSELSKLAGELL
ncbi:MAG: PhoH family protein [Candidatus Dependentiae bacterium]